MSHFDRAKPTLKMLLASWNIYKIEKRFRSLNAKNLGSVSQRAAKLLALKVRVLKKKSAASAIPAKVCASAIGPGLRSPRGSNHSRSLKASNFAALWPTDPKFLALKLLHPFKTL